MAQEQGIESKDKQPRKIVGLRFRTSARQLPVLALATLVLIVFYLWYNNRTEPRGGTIEGYLLGFVSLGISLFLLFYSVRRRLWRWRLGSLQSWLYGHLYLGLFNGLVVLAHSGFHLVGSLSIILTLMFVLVTISGLVGFGLYLLLPRRLSHLQGIPLFRNELAGQIEQLDRQIQVALAEQSEAFQKAYRQWHKKRIRPGGLVFWWALLRGQLKGGIPASLPGNPALPATEQAALQQLWQWMDRQQEMELLHFSRRLMSSWLWVHLSCTALFMVLLVFHLVAVYYF